MGEIIALASLPSFSPVLHGSVCSNNAISTETTAGPTAGPTAGTTTTVVKYVTATSREC